MLTSAVVFTVKQVRISHSKIIINKNIMKLNTIKIVLVLIKKV